MSPVVTIASIIPLSVLTAFFPDEPRLAGFIGAKDNGNGVTGAPVKSSPPTNEPKPNFLQVECPSCRPTNSVEALKKNLHHSFSSKIQYGRSLVLVAYPGCLGIRPINEYCLSRPILTHKLEGLHKPTCKMRIFFWSTAAVLTRYHSRGLQRLA